METVRVWPISESSVAASIMAVARSLLSIFLTFFSRESIVVR